MHGKGIASSTSRQDDVALASLHLATLHNQHFTGIRSPEQDGLARFQLL